MNWFKRRGYKALRSKIANFQHFNVEESIGLFGDPYGLPKSGTDITASNAFDAVQRFCKRYARINKKVFDVQHYYMRETTESWGKLKVTNIKTGFKTYFM